MALSPQLSPFPPLLLISNPKSGDGTGPSFVQDHVVRILSEYNVSITRSVVTDAPGRAGSETLAFLDEHKASDDIALVVSGGDGTIHEIVNAICSATDAVLRPHRVLIALVPTGTANALFSSSFPASSSELATATTEYRLRSLESFVRGAKTTKRLSIMKTDVQTQGSNITSIYSAVVTSTSLHASILYDSEALRAEIPDMSRFKVAAMKNITRWYHSKLILHPTSEGGIWLYDHQASQFAPLSDSQGTMEGPFAYFLSTVNVDRLEPSFVITPLYDTNPPRAGSMDIIIIRPDRDPSAFGGTEEARKKFAEKMGYMFTSAYANGSHIRLTYGQDGKLAKDGNDSPAFVEYVRCGGWQWVPDVNDDAAHLVCSDGTTLSIQREGSATCNVLEEGKISFLLCV